MQFQISADGRVASVKTIYTTVQDAELERCVLAAVKAMKLPRPEGGGVVEVTFPFIAELTGG